MNVELRNIFQHIDLTCWDIVLGFWQPYTADAGIASLFFVQTLNADSYPKFIAVFTSKYYKLRK